MLASLAAFSALALVQNQQFPKPDVSTPAVLRDRSIFKYLGDQDVSLDYRPLPVGRDWSSLVVPPEAPNAQHLKVLLTVAERDFSDPHYSNTLENRDKTRLLEAVGRLKSLYLAVSGGNLVLDIVPRFCTDPFFSIQEFKDVVDSEYNRGKFVTDDTVERGPFAGVLAISSSHVTLPNDPNSDFSVVGFADLGGSGQDMWIEEGLFYLLQSSIQKRLTRHFSQFSGSFGAENPATKLYDPLASLQPNFRKLFDPTIRDDADLLSGWSQAATPSTPPSSSYLGAPVQSPGDLSLQEGTLYYKEVSLLRAGEFALPASSKLESAKSLTFEIKTTGRNPIAVHLTTDGPAANPDANKIEYVIGDQPGMIPIKGDNTWQPITIPLTAGGKKVTGITIGVPREFFGTTRIRAELNQYWFRNFDFSSIDATPISLSPAFGQPTFDTEDSLRDVLTNGSRYSKRKALQNLAKIKTFKNLEQLVYSLTNDLDAGIAHDATKAYIEIVLAGENTAEERALVSKFFNLPPNESAREAALEYAIDNPSITNFASVSQCSVRSNWSVRRLAMEALGALVKANIKEKLAARSLLRLATNQDMATIRRAAVRQLDPNVPQDLDTLVRVMVNDPCESVRLECLHILGNSPLGPKDKILGTLADDSPGFRERIPLALGATNPLLREVAQKMVVDQDAYVRAEGLNALAGLGPVQVGEIQNCFTDKHPAVQLALLNGAKKGTWKLPADTIERLKQSPIKAIATMASELK